MFYRKRILRPTWMALAHLQAWLDKRVTPNVHRGRVRRVAADLERYITKVQKVGSPLVILMEFPPPSSRYSSWFPGMAARVAMMNEATAEMVRRVDKPNVRYFHVNELIDKYHEGDLDTAIPDGFHYTPQMHRLIGTLLAEQIGEWADTQPHLAIRD
jgi:lysophospholipase L1-like esterase